MHAFRKLACVAIVTSTIGVAQLAFAHAMLRQASPAANAALTQSPPRVQLQFSEKLEGTFSSIKVLDESGKPVDRARAVVDASDPTVMTLSLPQLAPGKYTVRYVAVSDDSHRRKGSYAFTVK